MQHPSPSGIIFDLDGTLIDSAPDIAASLNRCFAARGWPQVEVDFVARYIGHGARRLLLDILQALQLPHDAATVLTAAHPCATPAYTLMSAKTWQHCAQQAIAWVFVPTSRRASANKCCTACTLPTTLAPSLVQIACPCANPMPGTC